MAILKSMQCRECEEVFIDMLITGEEKCSKCGGELKTCFFDYNLGTAEVYRPTLARKNLNRPKKVNKYGKPID